MKSDFVFEKGNEKRIILLKEIKNRGLSKKTCLLMKDETAIV